MIKIFFIRRLSFIGVSNIYFGDNLVKYLLKIIKKLFLNSSFARSNAYISDFELFFECRTDIISFSVCISAANSSKTGAFESKYLNTSTISSLKIAVLII